MDLHSVLQIHPRRIKYADVEATGEGVRRTG